jgi:hypothetical protein
LVAAVYTIATTTLVLEFDQPMNQASLPVGNGTNIQLDASGTDRHGRSPVSWLNATHLSVNTTTIGAVPLPTDTTRCADTSGMISAGAGVQAQTWDLFPLTIVP